MAGVFTGTNMLGKLEGVGSSNTFCMLDACTLSCSRSGLYKHDMLTR